MFVYIRCRIINFLEVRLMANILKKLQRNRCIFIGVGNIKHKNRMSHDVFASATSKGSVTVCTYQWQNKYPGRLPVGLEVRGGYNNGWISPEVFSVLTSVRVLCEGDKSSRFTAIPINTFIPDNITIAQQIHTTIFPAMPEHNHSV